MHDVPLVEASYDAVPLFPLAKFAMFPNTMTQVHAYEPRYRMLVADVIAGSRLLVLVGTRSASDNDLYGAAPIHDVGALCKVVNHERSGDGRYCLQVHCLARVRIHQINRLLPYRTAAVQVLRDGDADPAALDEAMARLMATMRSLVVKLGDGGAPLAQILASTRKPHLLVNRLASAVISDAEGRQRALECDDPLDRIERVNDAAGEALLHADCPELRHAQFDGECVN